MDLECAEGVSTLINELGEYEHGDKLVIHRRVVDILSCAETLADRYETWDTVLFLGGFLGSLVVVIATAVNMAGFMTRTAFEALSTTILVLSSLGTAALGLRERLKLKEAAILNRHTATTVQRMVFLFLARAGPYKISDAGERFRKFMVDLEAAKAAADRDHLKMRRTEDQPAAASSSSSSSFPVQDMYEFPAQGLSPRNESSAMPPPTPLFSPSRTLRTTEPTQPVSCVPPPVSPPVPMTVVFNE
jgi:hypothetical protein